VLKIINIVLQNLPTGKQKEGLNMGKEMPAKLSIRMPWGLEISDKTLKEIVRKFEASGKELFAALSIKDLALNVSLEDEGTTVPLSETSPFLNALGLPIKIFDRLLAIALFDQKNQMHQITGYVTRLTILRGVQIQLFINFTDHLTTSYCEVYLLAFLCHAIPPELGGPSFYKPDTWKAEMINVGTRNEATWKAEISFC